MDRQRRFCAFVARGHDPHPTILNALEFARDFLQVSSLNEQGRVKAAIVVEELVSNMLRHGGEGQDIALELSLTETEDGVEVAVEDDGTPFDPVNDTLFRGVDPKTGGGVGLAIVRAWGEEIRYSRNAERNHLMLMIR